jgi:division protein CdvB (Snf7/Vps24/ESCRT-III family)
VCAFQHNSQAYARTIAQLRRIQSKIDAQALTITAQYADKLKEVSHTTLNRHRHRYEC